MVTGVIFETKEPKHMENPPLKGIKKETAQSFEGVNFQDKHIPPKAPLSVKNGNSRNSRVRRTYSFGGESQIYGYSVSSSLMSSSVSVSQIASSLHIGPRLMF